jgi:nucleoside-diphosphate-sugar epimerase
MSHSNAHRGHALVTGASSGIGASRLLHDDWYVIGLDRTEPTINAPRFSSLTLDLLDAEDVHSALDTIKVNAFVHAAGFMRVGELGSLDLAAGTDMWRVNVAAAMLLADTLAPKLPRGGRIVLIGSRTASGAAGRSQYVATKSASGWRAHGRWSSRPAPSPSKSCLRVPRKRRCCVIQPAAPRRRVFPRSVALFSPRKSRRSPRFYCPKKLPRSQASRS